MGTSFLLEPPLIIEGIGPVYAERLSEAGINNIAAFFRAGLLNVYNVCQGPTKKQVANWFCAAALLRVQGMNADLAEFFVRAGIRSVRKLADTNHDALVSALKATDSSRNIETRMLTRLQQAASKALNHGLFAGRIVSKNRAGIGDVRVDIGRFETQTNEDGWFAFDQLPEQRYFPRVLLANRPNPLRLMPVNVTAGKLQGPVVLNAGDSATSPTIPIRETHELDGVRIVNTRSTTTKLSDKDLDQFRPGTLFEVRKIVDDTATLLSLYLVKRGLDILVERAKVPLTVLPEASGVGKVLLWEDSKLHATDHTRKQVNQMKRDAAKATRTRRTYRRMRIQVGQGVIHLG